MSTSLIPIDHVNSLELFTKGGLDDLLKKISDDVKSFVPDLESNNGRKEIATTARKVASSKVVIDKAGKGLVSEWKAQAKVVDASRRHARKFLDALRDDIKKPLDDWKAEVERKAVAKLRALELIEAEAEAHAENELFDRERDILAREEHARDAELARIEEEEKRQHAEERTRLEKQMRIDAEAKAKREAAEAIEREKERAEQAERDKIEAEKKAKREKEEAKERALLQAKQAAQEKVEAQERADREATEAAERAEREKAEAVERERRRAEAQAAEEKRQEAARAADRENRRKVNTKIVAAFKAEGMGEKTAQNIVRLVASGGIPHMTIRY